ncbi:MAG: hypothetical protein RLZ98_2939 [Pseudomonadota bacterium]|jgi:hypothetical protein
MRRLVLLLVGIVLIGAAAGAFAYRQMLSVEGMRAERPAAGKPAPVRTVLMRGTEVSYPIDDTAPARSAAPGRRNVDSIEMFNFVFNLLNVVVGILGVWFAGQSLRASAPRQAA